MKPNAYFDLKRFGRLIAHDLRLNATKYLLMLAAFALVLYVWLVNQMRLSPSSFMSPLPLPHSNVYTSLQGYESSFLTSLIGLGIFIGMSFTGWGSKVRRLAFLQLPASSLEKFLHPFLLRFVGGALVFALIFWLDAQLARFAFDNIHIGNEYTVSTMDAQNRFILFKPDAFSYSMFVTDSSDAIWISLGVISLAAFLFVVPLYFKKMALIKTLFVGALAVFLVVCMFVFFSHQFYPDQTSGFNVHLQEVMLTKNTSSIELAACMLVSVSWLFFLFIGFFKLKETKL